MFLSVWGRGCFCGFWDRCFLGFVTFGYLFLTDLDSDIWLLGFSGFVAFGFLAFAAFGFFAFAAFAFLAFVAFVAFDFFFLNLQQRIMQTTREKADKRTQNSKHAEKKQDQTSNSKN